MICRYCGNAYPSDATRCEGCGAPKGGLVQKALDVTKTPPDRHWIESFSATVLRVFVGTVVVSIVAMLMVAVGWGEMAAVFALFWAMPVAPSVLGYASWRSARGSIIQMLLRLWLACMIWGAVLFTMIMVAGVIVTGEMQALP